MLQPYELAERSITKKYRKALWGPFVAAIKRYHLVREQDKIAVCVSGGKDSMLMAKLFQLLQRYSEVPFELVFLCMDPGYSVQSHEQILQNAHLLRIPLQFFETDIFETVNRCETSPCYVCARMRRGYLYKEAKALGCNKIALGHHRDDVVETTLIALFYGSQLQAMLPMLNSQHYPGMQLIRPLYCIQEKDIIAWQQYNHLEFLHCACRLTESRSPGAGGKRQEIKSLLRILRKDNPNIENSIFHAIHAVCLDTFPGYNSHGVDHSFLESFDSFDADME